jgi:hypothetical protein
MYVDDDDICKTAQAAKCVFLKYGTGGDVINHDALCILSLNIINEKVIIVNN